MSTTTWRKLITDAMGRRGDSWDEVIGAAMAVPHNSWSGPPDHTEPSLDREFDDGYGGIEGDSFTVWTQRFVYFPVVYDGAETVGSVPRFPCPEAAEHVGGGG